MTHDGFFDGCAIGIELEAKKTYFLRFKDNGIEVAKGVYFVEKHDGKKDPKVGGK